MAKRKRSKRLYVTGEDLMGRWKTHAGAMIWSFAKSHSPLKGKLSGRYLYIDNEINPENPTDFDDPKFDAEFNYAVESKITAADIRNIFSDMAIYSDTGSTFTPENVHAAIDHIKGRNDMANKNYLA